MTCAKFFSDHHIFRSRDNDRSLKFEFSNPCDFVEKHGCYASKNPKPLTFEPAGSMICRKKSDGFFLTSFSGMLSAPQHSARVEDWFRLVYGIELRRFFRTAIFKSV